MSHLAINQHVVVTVIIMTTQTHSFPNFGRPPLRWLLFSRSCHWQSRCYLWVHVEYISHVAWSESNNSCWRDVQLIKIIYKKTKSTLNLSMLASRIAISWSVLACRVHIKVAHWQKRPHFFSTDCSVVETLTATYLTHNSTRHIETTRRGMVMETS